MSGSRQPEDSLGPVVLGPSHGHRQATAPIREHYGQGRAEAVAPNRRNLESQDKNRCRTTPTAS